MIWWKTGKICNDSEFLRIFLGKQKQKILQTQEIKYGIEQFDELIYTEYSAKFLKGMHFLWII